MGNLRRSLEWSGERWPLPQRLPRRAARVSYLRGPFKGKISIRHYIFHDWRYQFTFRGVQDVRAAVSTVLGSMTPETSCVCHFSWHSVGAPSYTTHTTEEEALQIEQELQQGLAAVRRKQSEEV